MASNTPRGFHPLKALPQTHASPAVAQHPTEKGWCPNSMGRAPSTPRGLSPQKCPLVPVRSWTLWPLKWGVGGKTLKDAVSVAAFIPFVCGGLCGFATEKEVGLGIPRRVLPEAGNQGG